MCKIKTNPGSTQGLCLHNTFLNNPGSTRVEPASGGGLDLTRVEPGLAVFTRQNLTRVSFNPGRTRVSLCRVNRPLDLTRVENGLAVFTRQKLTRVSFNPSRTRVSLCRVSRPLDLTRVEPG